jgi:CHAT domain-containing protein
MNPRIRSLCLSMTLAILSLAGLSIGHSSPFGPSIALAQSSDKISRKAEADRLLDQGTQQLNVYQLPVALQALQRALAIYREIKDRLGEGNALGTIGNVYVALGDYNKAIQFHQQRIAIARKIGDKRGEESSLKFLEFAHPFLENLTTEIELHQRRLAIAREVGDKRGEENALGAIGVFYHVIGKYPKAIKFHQRRLAITREVGDKRREGYALRDFGRTYLALGDYTKAIKFSRKYLAIARDFEDRRAESEVLEDLGLAYSFLKDHTKEIKFHQKRLAIAQELKDRHREGYALRDLGILYYSVGNYTKAIEFNQQVLTFTREIKDRFGEESSLKILGFAYSAIGNYAKAFDIYQQRLAVARKTKYEVYISEEDVLADIAYTLKNQKQFALAIVFYKQLVNNIQGRKRYQNFGSTEEQKFFVEFFSYSYRSLADLLLQQNRIVEAQQVLDLLKVQELQDYLRTVRGNATTAKGLDILKPEQQILAKYDALQNSAIQLGQELSTLRQFPDVNRTPTQQQRIAQLTQFEEDLNRQFNEFTRSPDVAGYLKQLTFEIQQQTVSLADLDALRNNLKQLNAILLYPLILPDRLELIITTPDSAPLRRTVKVSNAELNQTILEFRQQMKACETRTCTAADTEKVKAVSQQLYTWLIKPLEADLKQTNAQSIIYAPDGQLRYIPLAALHDGTQWLAQRYRVNNITAKSLDSLQPQPHQTQMRVLAGAFTQGSYQFNIGSQQFNFDGLPFARKEIAQLVAAVPGTTQFLDKAFSLDAVKPRMNEYNVLHLATHAAFLPGQPEDSFILFGNGDRATLRDIENWSLFNVDMVILSACETALGLKMGNGAEILGLGYQFQNRGVKTTIASLWQVNDESTQILMNTLYSQLKQGNTSKAEALRQAQLTLIQGKGQTSSKNRAGISAQPTTGKETSQPTAIDYSHPYYWAPFILIGNGL